jgi:hypothetical protein
MYWRDVFVVFIYLGDRVRGRNIGVFVAGSISGIACNDFYRKTGNLTVPIYFK